jgi:hypothetical protein
MFLGFHVLLLRLTLHRNSSGFVDATGTGLGVPDGRMVKRARRALGGDAAVRQKLWRPEIMKDVLDGKLVKTPVDESLPRHVAPMDKTPEIDHSGVSVVLVKLKIVLILQYSKLETSHILCLTIREMYDERF